MKNSKIAIYAGSFDPFTYGHQDIVDRALKVFDKVVVLVAISPSKKSILSNEQKVYALQKIYTKNERVEIDTWDGLIVDYAHKNKIKHIIRGLRPTGDFDNEFQMYSMNRDLNKQVDTVFFMTGHDYYYVSSSLVKEIFNHGEDISKYVPEVFIKLMQKNKK